MALGMILNNIFIWMMGTFLFMILFFLLGIIIIVISRKTHAIIELKAWISGKNIAMFFQENRYCEWKAIASDTGIIQDKKFGCFIINERATYIDKKTKNILIPFDASIGASINVKAAKLADDLQYIVKDEKQFQEFRRAIASGEIDDNATLNVLKTSIHFGAIKGMMTALIPHSINAKIEKTIASRMKAMNMNQPLIIFYLLGCFIAGVALTMVIYHFAK